MGCIMRDLLLTCISAGKVPLETFVESSQGGFPTSVPCNLLLGRHQALGLISRTECCKWVNCSQSTKLEMADLDGRKDSCDSVHCHKSTFLTVKLTPYPRRELAGCV